MRSTATPHQRRNGSKEKRGRGLQEDGRERMRPTHPVVAPARFAAKRVAKDLEERPLALFGEGSFPLAGGPSPELRPFKAHLPLPGRQRLQGVYPLLRASSMDLKRTVQALQLK